MQIKKWYGAGALGVCLLCGFAVIGSGQSKDAAKGGEVEGGRIKGKVRIENKELPVHNVIVLIAQLNRSVATDEQGDYEFKDVPAGSYSLIARLERVPEVVRRVEVRVGETVTADIELRLSGIREQVTISATGAEQTAFEAFQGVIALDSTALLEKTPLSLGDALEHQTGVAKRSSGPGSSRPVIRGFDGDRVLIAQDGIRTGSLSYASGDHGEPINLLSVERVEVVRGPATLLYGSSAIGGLVNTISGHDSAHKGLRGFFNTVGGTNNGMGGASGGVEGGTEKWLIWANGGGQRAGDYETPLGKVLNSGMRNYDVSGGGGYYGKKGFLRAGYALNSNRFGVPFDPAEEDPEAAVLDMKRHNARINAGFHNLSGGLDHIHLSFDYTDYKHQELIFDVPETSFFNKTYSYRAVADQKRAGRFSGSFGVSGFRRDFETVGEEALAPPTNQNSFAAFALESIDLGSVAFQFGGRVEHNGYDTVESETIRNRAFTGFSGSAGIRVPVWEGGAFSANYTHSYRAPSLDELYNNGPHPGNLTFEIGDTNLKREVGDGVDISLRQASDRFRAEFHYFFYNLRDFIFLSPTGEEEDGFPVAEYLQGDSRFFGAELDLSAGLHRNLWLHAGLDYVNAELKDTNTPLPRIPPLRGRVGFDFQYNGFRLNPEVVMARDQDRLFTNETRTPGYAVVNVLASFTVARQHSAHIFSVNGFNLGDKPYFNHLSFIKGFAPEIGRGVRFTYTVRFF
ncbi:MAG TPA: TonB-dependent receptor [Blastocatellia bacterium]|nr:TonB-dependent receptor [Blastocatellia bacterium]